MPETAMTKHAHASSTVLHISVLEAVFPETELTVHNSIRNNKIRNIIAAGG